MSEALTLPSGSTFNSTELTAAPDRWLADLSLGFELRGNRTVISHRRHRGPLRVQKPFYPEGGPCHLYLLHPPGGMAGQDEICIDVQVDTGAHALLTTPAANKVYRSDALVTSVQQSLHVEEGTLEWLPQNTICFGGSALKQSTDVHLRAGTRFMGWDVIALGRPASGDHYETGSCEQAFTVYLDDQPLYRDRQQWIAGTDVMSSSWGLGGQTAVGTFLIYAGGSENARDWVTRARTLIEWADSPTVRSEATAVDGLLVIRALGSDAVQLQDHFAFLWAGLRQPVLGRPPSHPRVWAT